MFDQIQNDVKTALKNGEKVKANTLRLLISKLKNIDLCVFCTGIHDPKSERKINIQSIRKIMEVNFFGTINSINSIYDYYNEKKSGQICIVSSVAGYRGLPAGGAYCASKSALTSFAESLHFEMKRKNVFILDRDYIGS